MQPSSPLVLDGGSAVRNEHSPPTNIMCTLYVCECECGFVGVYVSVCIHCMYMQNVPLYERDFLCSPSLPNMEQYFVHVYIHTCTCTHNSQYTKSYAFTTCMYVYTVFCSYLSNHPDTLVSVEVDDCREVIKNGLQ